MCILLIEESSPERSQLAARLRDAGFATEAIGNVDAAFASATRASHRVILMDAELPGTDGFELLERLRAEGTSARILLLTSEGAELDRVRGLNAGADDCVSKPFSFEELVARVQALLRGTRRSPSARLEVEDLVVDTAGRVVTRAGVAVRLSAREFHLLEYLARRANEVVTSDELEDHIYGPHSLPNSNSIASAVCILRKKLARAGGERAPLWTLRGRGYRLGAQT